jgi:hypothetical protein
LLLFASAVTPLAATTYVRMSDETLVERSPLIVEGWVESVQAAPTETPRTDYLVRVLSTLKGRSPAEGRITVRVLGGRNRRGVALRVWGAPSFSAGDVALLFLRRNPDSTYGIEQLIFGAFRKVSLGNQEIAWRDLSEAQEMSFGEGGGLEFGAGRPEAPRAYARFRSWVRARAIGGDTTALTYGAEAVPPGAEFTFMQTSGQCGDVTPVPIRWFSFPAPVAIRAYQDGQPGVAGGGFAEVQTALAVWTNEPNTNVNYVYGGTTSSTAGCSNSIVFEDPEGDIAGSFSVSGTVAIGGPCFTCPTQVHNGTAFHATAKAFVITQDGIASIFDGSSPNRKAEELFAHELGHTLGLGHTSVPNSLMNPNLHNPPRGAVLSSDDQAGLAALYENSAPPPVPPSAPTGLAATTVSSTTVDLAWSDKSGNESEFRIERDSTADGFDNFVDVATVPANSTSFADDNLSPSALYRFRVRARNGAGNSGFSNTASATTLGSVPSSAPAPPAGAWLETNEVAGFRFKVRIGSDRNGTQVADCVPDTLCVAGAIADRTEVFLRVIGPRPNNKLWAQMVRFSVSRVEIWIDQVAGAPLRYYDLASLPASTLVLSGINDSEAFDPKELTPAAVDHLALTDSSLPASEADPAAPAGAWLETPELPGFRFKTLIGEGGSQRDGTKVTDCVPETLCVAGSIANRTEVFVRLIGPRGNGFLWAQLVRFTVAPVELWIEQSATLAVRYYKLDKLPSSTTELPGRNDSQAFLP